MLSRHEAEAVLERVPPGLRDIVLELRNMVTALAPQAAEEFRRHGFVIYDSRRGGPVSAGICQILVRQECIELAFIHGAFLPDPCGLLQGKARYKKYVRLTDFDQAPWGALQALMAASLQFDPRAHAAGRPDA